MTDHIDAPKAELENCPFCDGGTPKTGQLGQEHPAAGQWMVACTNYWCAAHSGYFPTEAEAVAAWNCRASYAETVAPYVAAQRMVREAIGELFGPLASIESDEAVLRRGPEPKHEAEAQIAALRRVAQEREAVGVADVSELVATAKQWQEWAFKWSGSAFIADEAMGADDMTEAEHKAELYADLCVLGNHMGWLYDKLSVLVSPPVEAKPAKGVTGEELESNFFRMTPSEVHAALSTLEPTPPQEGVTVDGGNQPQSPGAQGLPASLGPEGNQPDAWILEREVDGAYERNVSLFPITDGDRSYGWRDTPLYASPPATASGVSEDLTPQELQLLMRLRDNAQGGVHDVVEGDQEKWRLGRSLSDRGYLAMVNHPRGATFHITRLGIRAIEAALNLGREG